MERERDRREGRLVSQQQCAIQPGARYREPDDGFPASRRPSYPRLQREAANSTDGAYRDAVPPRGGGDQQSGQDDRGPLFCHTGYTIAAA